MNTPNPESARNSKTNGFSIVEVAIFVAVIAIIATVALPTWSDWVIRGKLRSGIETLTAYHQQLQATQRPSNSDSQPVCLPAKASSEFFELGCEIGENLDYLLTATSKPGRGLGHGGDYTYQISGDGAMSTLRFRGVTLDSDRSDGWILN